VKAIGSAGRVRSVLIAEGGCWLRSRRRGRVPDGRAGRLK
jgi:hypothetical protein